jgi:hypothetical protein
MYLFHKDGTSITVWVVPGASRTEMRGLHDGMLRIGVADPAEGGKANRELERLMMRSTRARSVTLSSGARGRRKTLLLEGIEPNEARQALVGDSP